MTLFLMTLMGAGILLVYSAVKGERPQDVIAKAFDRNRQR